MKIQTGHLDGEQSDTNVQLSGLIWPNRAILVKLRMRKCGNASLRFAGQLKFLTLLLELRNLKSIFISDRCANFEPPYCCPRHFCDRKKWKKWKNPNNS